jgi:nucleoside-diphosphate-sugar epimerase
MRIFFAGASGLIGRHVLPLLINGGHIVGAMTRSADKAGHLEASGALPIVCDVFDRPSLTHHVRAFAPDLLLHELTDLPDDLKDLPADSALNARIRDEGTRNLIDATSGLAEVKVVAQSVAWSMEPGRESAAVGVLEESVLAVGGVVLRYGLIYGPGTYFDQQLPPTPRVHVDTAAARTVEALAAPSGVVTILDD